jgi:polar amino acid transport system substrate-binding protein
LAASLFGHRALAAEPELRVGVQPDIPPYIMEKATKGLEVDILRRALADYTLHFTQLSYKELQTAVREGKADVAANVQPKDNGVFYSRDFLTFANYAISKKADGLKIDRVADLKNHPVLTWQDAYLVLGDEFEGLFSPGWARSS